MKLLVLGATGGVGLETVRQAVEQGHTVTTLVRSPQALTPLAARITIRQGDLLNPMELARAMEGQDVVLSAFGPRLPLSKTDDNLLTEFAGALTQAMTAARLTRAVIVSTAFLFKDALLPPAHLAGKLFFPTVVADATRMETVVRNSGLEWTLVRPPQLTDKPRTGTYHVREGRLPRLGFHISRADVADFVLKSASDPGTIRKIIGVAD